MWTRTQTDHDQSGAERKEQTIQQENLQEDPSHITSTKLHLEDKTDESKWIFL